jgi:hypothetical protein
VDDRLTRPAAYALVSPIRPGAGILPADCSVGHRHRMQPFPIPAKHSRGEHIGADPFYGQRPAFTLQHLNRKDLIHATSTDPFLFFSGFSPKNGNHRPRSVFRSIPQNIEKLGSATNRLIQAAARTGIPMPLVVNPSKRC